MLFAVEPAAEHRLGRAGPAAAAERVERPILWEATEKQDPKKRRTNIGILMKTWEKLAEPFLDRLRLLDFSAILSDTSFNEDLFEQLIEMVKGVGATEWARLRESDANAKYEWDRPIEGFFKRLQDIPCFKERLMSLHRHLGIERDLGKLEKRVSQLDGGLGAIRQSEALRVVLRKLLRIGNCLNAGSGSLGRADGFDTVSLLERTLLIDMPKAADGRTSLLQFIRDRELDESEREAFGDLERTLAGWRVPSGREDEADPTDLQELRRDSEAIGDQLARLEADLGLIQQHLASSGFSGPGEQLQLAKQLSVLAVYTKAVKDRRRRLEDLRLQELGERLLGLQRYLLHAPPERRRLSAGRILGVIAQLAQRLAPVRQEVRKAGEGGLPRSSSVAPPSPDARREAGREPARRRCASVDSAVTVPGPREPSREPARSRFPVRSSFRPFRA
mmetsp:Transcript_90872/g.287893  ORF Transcript_90872/g.287893 Transcript_90872/m.287893 type:complete len:447 (+) Transcript_90872:271-1611(+)